MVRFLFGVGALASGLLMGIVGAFVQAARWVTDWGTVPYGLILALGLLLVLIRGFVEATLVRWTGWLVFAGWLIATVVYAAELPSGSLVISAGGRQMAYLLGGVIIAAAAATVPPVSRLRTPRKLPPQG